MTSLYYLLGVTPDATASQIKKAYRDLAKIHHPDKGGDAERFREITRAFTILSDAEKRKTYDETGAIDDGAEQNADGPAIAMLDRLLNTLIVNVNLWTGDLLQEMRRALAKATTDVQNQVSEIESRLKTAEKQKSRLKRKPAANPALGRLIELQITKFRETIASGKDHEAMLARAGELLDGYSMEPDRPTSPTSADAFTYMVTARASKKSGLFGNIL